MQRNKRLQHYVNMSWLLPGAVALITSLCLFLILGSYNYFRDLKYAQNDLDSKVQAIARRLSAELLISPRGSPDAVTMQVAKELGLSDVSYGSRGVVKKFSRTNSLIYSESPVPFLEDKYVIRAAALRPSIFGYFNFSILLSCFLLIGFIVGFGIFLQTRYLTRHLIRPIEALVETSTGDKSTSSYWPLELQDISQKLSDSFHERERIVYSQIARGVVHDIKTILQSFKVASDLAIESPTDARIQNLLNVSKNKFPSLLELIDTTLDGSREIPVFSKPNSINKTIHRSIENVRALSSSSKTEIEVKFGSDELIICHDPVQLERVFTNLFKNGLEAIEEKGKEKGKLKISFKRQIKGFVTIVVEDSGIGLPKNPDSVFRLLKSTKPHGSGLGLLVSKKIVDAHGGRIVACHSRERHGARFEVSLPHGASS